MTLSFIFADIAKIKYPCNIFQPPNHKIKFSQNVVSFQSRNLVPAKFNTFKVINHNFYYKATI